MAFNVIFYNFAKRDNSFKLPNVAGTTMSCRLKGPCSFQNPVIELTDPSTITRYADIKGITYAYIADFGRYYFVDRWTLDGIILRAQLSVDVLASFRTQVLATSQYVLRSSSNYDGFVKDTRYPIKAAQPSFNGTMRLNPLAPSVNNPTGIYVLGIVNSVGSITGSVNYYAFTATDCQYFMQQLFTISTQWTDGADIADSLKKAITDPMQYIVSAIWFPWSMQDLVDHSLVTGVQQIGVGYSTITLSGYAGKFVDLIDVEFTNVIAITKPDHPLATARGNYMNYEPYSRYYLSFYPFCGLLELDTTVIGGTIYLVYTVDLRTGKGVLNVCNFYTGSSWADWRPERPFRVIEAQVGVNIPLASIHTALPSSISEYVQNTVVAAASEAGGFGQMIKKGLTTIGGKILQAANVPTLVGPDGMVYDNSGSVADLTTPQEELQIEGMYNAGDLSRIASNGAAMKSTLEMIGAQGTMSFYDRMPIMLWGNFYTPVNDDVSKFGRPLCSSVILNTLSGFVMCDSPHLAIQGAYQNEIALIEGYLQRGAFIE